MSALRPWQPKVLPGPPAFVLDLSVALGWFHPQQSTQYTLRVLQRVSSTVAIVPTHWSLQIADRVREAERLGQALWSRIEAYLQDLSYFQIRVDDETPAHAWSDTLTLARTLALSTFDTAYLELAQRRKLPLTTASAALAAAATTAGVLIYSP
jgi:predicted nucleic acid-binding protein